MCQPHARSGRGDRIGAPALVVRWWFALEFDALKRQPAYTINDVFATPFKPRGAPGVALLDFDSDGDLDIFVTNGPGRCKSLYSNQLKETGKTTFVDVAMAAGVCAADMDATGVCFGDIDNDGFPDLLVLGRNEPNRLFRNQGNGTFVDITAQSGVGGGNLGHNLAAPSHDTLQILRRVGRQNLSVVHDDHPVAHHLGLGQNVR